MWPGRNKSAILLPVTLLVIAAIGVPVLAARRLDRRHDTAERHFQAALSSIRAGDLENGESELLDAVSYNPEHWRARYYLGGMYLEQGRLETARNAFAGVLKVKSDLKEAYNALGIVHFRLGQVEEATSYFLAALKLDPMDETIRALIETINGRGAHYPQ